MEVLLSVKNLRTIFHTYRGVVKALNGVSFDVYKKDFLGIVGETGCGKSVTSLSIMRLIEEPGEIVEGSVVFDGRDLLKLSEEEMQKVRAKEISMIFQEPKMALNPVLKIGFQIAEAISTAEDLSIKSKEVWEKVYEILRAVGLPDPESMAEKYPHELSGGMAQRIMIAMGLVTKPKLLIADEPTSALDVTIQAQILHLIKELVSEMDTTAMIITHNLGIVAEYCERVVIMYAGNVAEIGDVKTIFKEPLHPYTKGLIKAVPVIGTKGKLQTIKGIVPDLVNPPSGCRFHPRCEHAMDICSKELPPIKEVKTGHFVACHLYN
ncbi:MAG: peptide/nickel transport system ATP-binding protein [Thermotogaceae bacterium]|jgi:peptide/nickel transport system ATP-binding protein|nr:peptide/nickel transport system ATP-binding protein [Thermotogaceae bacterium]MDN5337566.1 peptide/nickel transport system ATP-binding protein [Thermotogaceae bacterium]